jgi:transcriptional regulator with XRE-family HTH domain
MLTGEKLGQAIAEAIEKKGISKKAIAERYGVKPPSVQDWVKRGTISKDKLFDLIDYFSDVCDNSHWGIFENSAFEKSTVEMPVNSYLVDKSKLAYPPVYGKAMGGLPDRLFTDEGRLSNGHDEYGEVYSSDLNAFITRVDGNSMIPKYHNGGYALVEPGTEPEIEDDVLIKLTTGQVMLKKLVSRRGGVVLASYSDPVIHTFTPDQIIWMYYVAYPVPARKIKNRV